MDKGQIRPDAAAPKGVPEPPAHRPGATTPVKDASPTPKQPHERDESVESGGPREVMRQAHDDVENGLVDTSRAEATDQAYGENLRSEPQAAGAAPAAKPPKAG